MTTLARDESKSRLLINIFGYASVFICVVTAETTTLETTTTYTTDNGMTLTNTAGNYVIPFVSVGVYLNH